MENDDMSYDEAASEEASKETSEDRHDGCGREVQSVVHHSPRLYFEIFFGAWSLSREPVIPCVVG